jgi:hypothetical protein
LVLNPIATEYNGIMSGQKLDLETSVHVKRGCMSGM